MISFALAPTVLDKEKSEKHIYRELFVSPLDFKDRI